MRASEGYVWQRCNRRAISLISPRGLGLGSLAARVIGLDMGEEIEWQRETMDVQTPTEKASYCVSRKEVHIYKKEGAIQKHLRRHQVLPEFSWLVDWTIQKSNLWRESGLHPSASVALWLLHLNQSTKKKNSQNSLVGWPSRGNGCY